ncbi:MAG TPA: type IV secretion system DNA-binding domain-containing protein [Panacibacter sp.]|nr:type IV secretion system DNA-binding domain-containing protein [Panacibacter sp.]HNP46067.1 type IV secretion system DNA-binding domain-containing protein [Panacibacter sp.]
MSNITYIGKTKWRDSNQLFGIKDKDRLGHLYVIGKTGTGKSTLLEQMAISDIERGNGLCIIDPHGDIAEHILHYIPKHRIPDVIYFNATDSEHFIAFNPLATNASQQSDNLITSNLISTFKKIWSESWGPRLEHILRYSILTLRRYPNATLLDIPLLLTDAFFRQKVLNYVTDTSIIDFWTHEFDSYTAQLKSEAITPVLNKIGILLASLPIRNIIGQPKSAFVMQDALDQKKILICNLSKGQIGEDAASILGSMLVTAIQTAALFRASYQPEDRTPFYLYIDEVHSFVTLSLADVLAEARKYGLSLFLSHQYSEQLHEKIRAAILGNVGTLICFRIGAADARYLAPEFSPVFDETDLVQLPKYMMYLKLMIDGATSKPFSATTLPIQEPVHSYKKEIVINSRRRYCLDKSALAVMGEKKQEQIVKNKEMQQSLFEHL